jgi:hypothetical protein
LLRFTVAAVWCVVAFVGGGLVYPFFPQGSLVADLLGRVLSCLLLLGGFTFLVRVLDLSEAPLLSALGLAPPRAAWRMLTGAMLGALLIAAGVLAIAAAGGVRLSALPPQGLRAALLLVLLFYAAAVEELCFRGYPLQKLTQAVGAPLAVLLLSLLFAAGHLANPMSQGVLSWAFLNTFLIGALLALARIRTGSLWFSIGLHLGWNYFQGPVFGFAVSGYHRFDCFFLAAVPGGRQALTGGAYGLEASATCTVLLLVLGLPLLWWLTRSRGLLSAAEAASKR